jgi:hypothetical protein
MCTENLTMNTTLQALEVSRLKLLPKAEVHLHLEGCFEASTIAHWAKIEGVALPRPQEDLFKFSGLADFLGFLDATPSVWWNLAMVCANDWRITAQATPMSSSTPRIGTPGMDDWAQC